MEGSTEEAASEEARADSPQLRRGRPRINLDDIASPFGSTQKDSDDPTAPGVGMHHFHRQGSSTRRRLNSLFTSQSSTSQLSSNSENSFYSPDMSNFDPSIGAYLFQKGLVQGLYSDVSVQVFSTTYQLHRIVLDQSPFFSSALSGPWLESSTREIVLHPEQTDPNITKASFEIALKRLYGYKNPDEEAFQCLQSFATASWLEMPGFMQDCVNLIIKSMQPQYLAPAVNLVSSSYYGKPGEAILEAAKLLLLREGASIPVESWDGIPSDIIREVLASDEFYISSEWNRFKLARKLLNRRLSLVANDLNIPETIMGYVSKMAAAKDKGWCALDLLQAIDSGVDTKPSDDFISMIYSHSEVFALLKLIEQGIYYVHLGADQLQSLRDSVDLCDVPLINSSRLDACLLVSSQLKESVKIWPVKEVHRTAAADVEFPIPTGNRHTALRVDQDSAQAIALPTSKSPEDYKVSGTDLRARATPFKGTPEIATSSPRRGGMGNKFLPPFRFSVEIDCTRLHICGLVHSQYVYYAGSHWSLYIRNWRSKNSPPGISAIYLRRSIKPPEIPDTCPRATESTSLFQYLDYSNCKVANEVPKESEVGDFDFATAAPVPFSDQRMEAKAYFKIFCIDSSGTLIHRYESTPEKFRSTRSWGWKQQSQPFRSDGGVSQDTTFPPIPFTDRCGNGNKMRFSVVVGLA